MLNQIEHKLRAPVSKKMACGHFPAIALHLKRRKIDKVSSEAPLETGEMEIYTMYAKYKTRYRIEARLRLLLSAF